MRWIGTMLTFVAALALLGGCSSPPCGNGLKVDDRPLPEAWKSTMPAYPKGATACYNLDTAGKDTGPVTRRSLSMPDKAPLEALKIISAHLEANGWKATMVSPTVLKDREGLAWWGFHKEGRTHKVEMWCSAMIEKGWCHMEFHTFGAKKK
jgi:hypothetical protein